MKKGKLLQFILHPKPKLKIIQKKKSLKKISHKKFRTASCIAETKTSCISLDHEIFKLILANHVRELNKKRLLYLSNIKLFRNWDRPSLAGLLSYLYLRNPKHGTYLYEEGTENNNIYIVVSGELELVANYRLKEAIEKEKHMGFETEKEKFEKKYMKEKNGNVEISLFKLSNGNYFGDEEGFISKMKKYSVKVISTNTAVFLIPKDV